MGPGLFLTTKCGPWPSFFGPIEDFQAKKMGLAHDFVGSTLLAHVIFCFENWKFFISEKYPLLTQSLSRQQ